jgi:predicted PurR-regulated permease PerM
MVGGGRHDKATLARTMRARGILARAAKPPKPVAMSFPQVPMFERKALIFWGVLALLVAGAWWLAGSSLTTFLIGFVLAYVLNPVVVRLRRLGLSRPWSVALVIIVFFFGLGLVVALTAPFIASHVSDFLRGLPAAIQRLQTILEGWRVWVENRYGVSLSEATSQISLSQFASTAGNWLTSSLRSVGTASQAVMSSLEVLLVVPFTVFYLLMDWERFVRALQRLVPVGLRPSVFSLTKDIDDMIGGFFRGQVLVCLSLGAFYAVALKLAGLNYGLVIGAISGLLAFIPYLGTATCLVLSFGFGIAQFWPDWTMLVAIGAIIAVGQFLEGNILTPRLVGRHIGLHPLALIFGLIVCGQIWGFVGLLLSVPLTGTTAIVLRRLAVRYRASDFFRTA